MAFRTVSGSAIALGSQLGAGGEARILEVVGRPDVVAKIYHAPSPAHEKKLRAMLANRPLDPTAAQGHVSIAWPIDLVTDQSGRCLGFLMPRIDFRRSSPLFKLYAPYDRKRTWPAFTWQYLLRSARNLASAVDAVHERGAVVGDLNESNILVADTALVSLVDCDSMQIPGPYGEVFRCPVWKPEFTPPELQGKDLTVIDRTWTSDSFALAVMTCLILLEGVHPFSGVWTGAGPPPLIESNIANNRCPFVPGGPLKPARRSMRFDTLPPALQALVGRCFGQGFHDPFARPSAREWRDALDLAEQRLNVCGVNRQHVFSGHLPDCPWCERVRIGISDPFPPLGSPQRGVGGQQPLPPQPQQNWRRPQQQRLQVSGVGRWIRPAVATAAVATAITVGVQVTTRPAERVAASLATPTARAGQGSAPIPQPKATATLIAPVPPAPPPTAEASPTPPVGQPPATDPTHAGVRVMIVNTGGEGVRYRTECTDESGTTGWPENTEMTVLYSRSDCPEWLLVRAPDDRSSWVRAQYLARLVTDPVQGQTPTPSVAAPSSPAPPAPAATATRTSSPVATPPRTPTATPARPVIAPTSIPVPPATATTTAARADYFTVGSTKDDVLNLHGQPTLFSEYRWDYGPSHVNFVGGKVTTWYSAPAAPLKARLVPSGPRG